MPCPSACVRRPSISPRNKPVWAAGLGGHRKWQGDLAKENMRAWGAVNGGGGDPNAFSRPLGPAGPPCPAPGWFGVVGGCQAAVGVLNVFTLTFIPRGAEKLPDISALSSRPTRDDAQVLVSWAGYLLA